MRIYLATPRLRGLLALSMTAAAGGAMVIVNTVVFVKGQLELGDGQVALALACFGGSSMLAALALPRLREKLAGKTGHVSQLRDGNRGGVPVCDRRN